MTSFAILLGAVRRELTARLRLLAAVFARISSTDQAHVRTDLMSGVNLVGQGADMQVWDWDLVTDRFTADAHRRSVEGGRELIAEAVHPEDAAGYRQAIDRALESGESLFHRYRMVLPDGGQRHVQVRARVFRNADGNAIRMLGIRLDVTEDVEHLNELRRQADVGNMLRDHLNLATETAGISIWDKDLVNGAFGSGEQFWKIFGLAPDTRFEVHNAIHPDERERALAPLNAAFADGNRNEILAIRHRSANPRPEPQFVQTHMRVFRDLSGKPIRLLGVTWDVTDEVVHAAELQRKAEQESKLLDRLSVATQAAGIAPWEFDLKTNRYMWYGTRLAVLGLDDAPLDTYDAALKNILLPEDRENLDNAAVAAIKSGATAYSAQCRARGTDGQVHHLKNFVRILRSPRGTPYRLIGVTWDISEEVAARELAQQQAEHERALVERLNVVSRAAGISPWEFDLKADKFTWSGVRLTAMGLDDEPNDTFNDALKKTVLPEDRHILVDAPVAAIKSGAEVYSYRYRAYSVDGQVHHLKNYVRILRSPRGKPYRLVGVTWDISEEVATSERLEAQIHHVQALKERLDIATQAAGIWTWEIDLLTKQFVLVENPLEVFHDLRSGCTVASFAQRIHPEDRTIFRDEIIRAAREGQDVITYCYRAFTRNNEITYVQNYAKLYFDAEGRVTRALGTARDITREVAAAEQLKQQTDRLRDAERRLERASLSSSEGHWEAELATSHLWCSSSFHTLLGYRDGELEPRVSTLDCLVHPDDLDLYRGALRRHLEKSELYDVKARMRMGNGEYRWFRLRGMAEHDADGQPTVMAGSIHDVHQQKLVEDALDLAQRRFERAINGTQDGLWEMDVATDGAWCSPRLALILGYSVTQLETKHFARSLIHPEDVTKMAEVTASHYRHNTPFDLEVRMKTRGGEYRWYRARAKAERDDNGRAIRLSGSLQDVTEARAAREELMRATETAEAANRAKSAFLANVSHEIRTPMNGIIGMTGLLIDTPLDRAQRDYADTIRSSADSLLTVINDILDFSKIEAGKLDLESIELDLRANVEDVGTMMAFQAASKGLELIVNVHPEISERVRGDPQRLRQCLINLVGNSIKFTKRGEIVIDVCVVGRNDGRMLTHFEVRDTGMGIPEETLKTLFQPFVQADSSTTRHFGGTGLGLSIVRRLVELMGGQMGVVSAVGEGSTFFFTLPLEPVDAAAPIANDISMKRSGNILIVDDNSTNRRVLSSQLSHAGYEVVAVDSGAAALEALQAAALTPKPFDMVVTDFQMPDMDGAMLGECISGIASLANIRLVMLTSLDRQGNIPRLAALGFAAYLTKPVRARELSDCVARVLSGEARQWQMEIRPMITRNTLSKDGSQQCFSGRVLVVEDNVVNQKVAMRFLQRMGCTVEIAEHGADGVAAYQQSRFDLVLMDLQMPVMDGITATRKIRELETDRRTPIVALTANVMRDDQARCEAAGMDGFLTKPIEVERLRDTLAKFGLAIDELPVTSRRQAASILMEAQTDVILEGAATDIKTNDVPVDLARINEITEGDAEFAQELVQTFISSGEQQLLEIDAAISGNDRDGLARAAHKLKGACANIHARTLQTLALHLEVASVSANSIALQACSTQLKDQFKRAKNFLNDPNVIAVPIKSEAPPAR